MSQMSSGNGSGSSPDNMSASDSPSPIVAGQQQSAAQGGDQGTDAQPMDRSASETSNGSSGSDGGLFIRETTSLPPAIPLAESSSPSGSADSESASPRLRERPVLRLAMLNAQEKARLRSSGEQHPVTAPVRSLPMELPTTGYFAPRGQLSRSNTSFNSPSPPITHSDISPSGGRNAGRKKSKKGSRFGALRPALRFASRDSVHTFGDEDEDDGDGDGDRDGNDNGKDGSSKSKVSGTSGSSRLYTPVDQPLPQAVGNSASSSSHGSGGSSALQNPLGLRRRLTRAATNNLSQISRALKPMYNNALDSGSETETESGHTSSTEQHMEKLLDKHANSAEQPPSNNIAANNAEITNRPDFYPVNPSMQNPGVIHMNMSGHEAAKNIVESVLGTVGTSTAQGQKRPGGAGEKSASQLADVTPADLEAGLGRPVPPVGSSQYRQQQQQLHQGYPPMGISPSPTSLRGVYSNLSKLQSRMAEHQERREKRLQELRLREQKRRKEEEERRRREEQRRSKGDDRGKWRTLDRLQDMKKKVHHTYGRSASGSPSGPPSTNVSDNEEEPGKQSFVLHSFRTMPKPASMVQLAESISANVKKRKSKNMSAAGDGSGADAHTAASSPATTPTPSPPRSATQSPVVSPAVTPGWEDILASSGMLTGGSIGGSTALGGAGSRVSMMSTDSTMQAFEAEKQKILSQLADIFNRQNFLLVCSRALMGFGAPLHRLEANLIAIALNLDIQATFAVLPGIILITFGDEDTRTSDTYVVRMTAGYDMHRLERTNRVIRRVLKGRTQVGLGVKNIEKILATPPIYPWWVMLLDYVICSFFICPLFWNGSWKDAGVSATLGLIVGFLQLLAGRFANYANLFEVSSAFIVSFIAALLQDYICFATVSFAGVAMLLPGLALTTSIIEMVSRNMITGTVRFVFALARCFILGYGISVGATLGTRVLGKSTMVDLIEDQMSSTTGLGNCGDGLSKFWWFLFLPALSLAFNVSISAHWRQWPLMLVAGCLAYTTSYFSGLSEPLAPLAPAIAAFAMGLYANILAAFANHRSAVEPILGGIQLLVPGSLGLRTVLAFITSSRTSSGDFLFDMFSTSLSIAAGLFLSGMVVFPNRKKRVGLMTF
ncbi:pheromone-regulated protein prm10 [Coemansia sp. RSA 2599]|nr:pheromone-regulated protein prm10 [Coemansia sp. RSA 2598]KAJ1829089.1 pheromone-regulated protein prm10 [Coemansia sp. RSA 2599]